MGTKQRIGLSLALGLCLGVSGFAQRHGGGGGAVHGTSMPGRSFNSGVHGGPGRTSFGGGNGFSGSHGYGGYGSNSYYNQGNRRGFAVGVLPFFPCGGYGYGGYDGGFDNGFGPYDSSVDNGQVGPYQGGGPYDQQYAPGPNSPGPYMDPQQPYAQQQQQMAAPIMMPPPPAYGNPAPMANNSSTPAAPVPPVTIVLRTGQQFQVQNFAVADGFFWDFSKAAPRKIPIANIDVAASQKMTEANGGEFPELSNGQDSPESVN